MKKVLYTFLVVSLISVVLLLFVFGMAKSNQSALVAQSRLSLPDLGEFEQTWNGPDGTSTNAMPPPEPPATTQRAAAPALARTLSQAEREAQWPARPPSLVHEGVMALSETAATALALIGSRFAGDWYWEAAQEADQKGSTGLARAYFRKALDYPMSQYAREWCCGRLAVLEDDPEVASRLLELSCAGNSAHWLVEAVKLAAATGSDAAQAYYTDRMRKVIEFHRSRDEDKIADNYQQWLDDLKPPAIH